MSPAPGADDDVLGDLDDLALLTRHREGDPDAFGILFARHRGRLWAVALRTCGNPEDAADALQEAMIAAFRRAESFRGEAAVTTWLHRIVVNAALDRLRRNAVRRTDALPDDLDEAVSRGDVLAHHAPDPAEAAVATEQRALVLAALEQIAPDQKAAIVLVDMQGYSVEAAASILECPTGTVKSRCARGRRRLAELLAPSFRPHEGTPDAPAASDPGANEGTHDGTHDGAHDGAHDGGGAP